MVADDRLERERIDARNALEEYVYHFRDLLETSLKEYVLDNDRNSYLATLSNQEAWLYEDGADEMRQVYIQRLDELKVRHVQIGCKVCSSMKLIFSLHLTIENWRTCERAAERVRGESSCHGQFECRNFKNA